MGVSTHAVGRATDAFQAMGPTNSGNQVTIVVHHSVTADLSANDVLQIIKIPNGAVITGGWISLDSSSAFTFEVGDGGDPNRFVTSASVHGRRHH